MTKTPKKATPKENDKEVSEIVAKQEGQRLILKCNNLFQYAEDSRRKHDWEWLVRNLYVRGYHFARYNRSSNTVTFANRSGVRIPVNLLYAHLRAVRNQVTSFRPKWEVMPNVTTESAVENATYSDKVLDYVYWKSGIKRAIKEVITHSLLFSIGIWQFDINKDKDIVVRTVDPYDFYIDPNVRSSDINDPDYGAEFVIKTMNMPLSAVKGNPHYKNTENLQASNESVSANYKRFLLQVTRQMQERQNKESPMVLVKECHIRERSGDDFRRRVVTYVDKVSEPLRDEYADDKEYPFEIYQGDLTPLEIYGESWAKHLIPINRVIDSLESHAFEYNHLFARGRFVVDKNSGVRVIVNQHGQIIEKNRGSTVTSLPIAPLPSSPREQIAAMRGYFEDLSGAHDVSLGRIPTGVKSGVGIAELRQADATNQDDLVDNLEDFLSRSGRKILKMAANNWNTSKLINVTGLGGKPEYFMAIGERASKTQKKNGKYTFGSMKLPLVVIGADNEVRVRVGSWLAYTKQARQEQLKELFRLGAIDQQALLEHLEFGDVDGVLKRTKEERLLQLRANRPSNSVLRMTGQEMSDEELALAENELMLEGKDQPVMTDDDHEVHLTIHQEGLDDKEYGHIIRAHINEHINQQRFSRGASSQPLPPEEEGQPQGGQPQQGGQQSPIPSPDIAMMMGGQ